MLSAIILLIVLALLAGHLRGCLALGMFGCLGIVLLVAVDPWQYADPGQYPQAWQ
jgi:anaerobic C4-dicarboxylate transporter